MNAEMVPSKRLQRFLVRTSRAVDQALDRLLPSADEEPRRLHAAMRYAVIPGGKRLRPALTELGFAAAGGRGRGALPAACAVELVHSFSLVHDDLPCMDDSAERRGQPSLHCAFDEATALLAGDALLALAFHVLSRPVPRWPGGAATAISRILAAATGAGGMIGGQAMERDLVVGASRDRPSPAALERVHRMKTGRLFEAAILSGGLAAGASRPLLLRLERYAEHLGLAFQIADDLLDLATDGSRAPDTYPGVLGAKRTRSALAQAHQDAVAAAHGLGGDVGALATDLADFVALRAS